ncbi:MAG: hypothetical protein OCD76_18515 [Reichenbachiella sp.]
MKAINLIFGWVILLLPIASIEASANDPILRFQHISEGLNSSQITAILQTNDDYVWVGTSAGLHKYDGIQFEVFLHNENPSSITGNYITSLFEDSRGDLWIGTADGICRYDRILNNFQRFETKTIGNEGNPFLNRLRSIVEDRNGNLWVASERGGLFFFDTEKKNFYTYPIRDQLDSLKRVRITTLEIDLNNTLWVGTFDQGVFQINLETNHVVQVMNVETRTGLHSLGFIMDIRSGLNGEVWIGTKKMGLFKFRNVSNDSVDIVRYIHNVDDERSLANDDVQAILLDSKNRLWVGNENGGLHLYDRKTGSFVRYQSDPMDEQSLAHNSVWCIYEDKQERLWVGGAVQGINLYDPLYSKFAHYYQSSSNFHGLSHNVIRDFLEDEQGNVWIGTDGGGLNYFDRKTNRFEHFLHDDKNEKSLSSNAVLGLCMDPEGKLWIGTWAGGINVFEDFEKKEFKNLREETSGGYSIKDHYFNIIKDHNGNMWAANFGIGLVKFDRKTNNFLVYETDPNDEGSLSANIVVTLLQDSKGTIWAGTDGFGINKMLFDEDGGVYFEKIVPPSTESTSTPSNIVNHLFEDSKGTIWIATENGLQKLNGDHTKITVYDERHGLPSVSIKSITEDDNGYLWLGTANGIVQFEPETLTVHNFNINDGLQGNEFSRYAVGKLKTGEILFGGINGFNIFHPDSIVYNNYSPPVYITDFKLFNKDIEIGGDNSPLQKHISVTEEIVIAHEQNVFSIQYTALNYTRSENNQFAFKLDGLEADWNYVGSQRLASYSNLDPGEYTFRVKASNNDGVWNEEGATLKITVLPPWWLTWWADTIMVIMMLIAVYAVVQIRTSYLNNQRNLLMSLVDERTDELAVKNERIASQSEELMTYNDSLNELNSDLNAANANLERTVEERTHQLIKKNKKLAKYAFINAHNLRVPVANIKGVIQLFDKEDRSRDEILELINILKGQSQKMDHVLIDIQRMLDHDGDLNEEDQAWE